MSETDFQAQETQRLQSEARVKALREGTPPPDSLQEFLHKYSAELAENPLLKEFLEKINKEYLTVAYGLRRRTTEQNLELSKLNMEIAILQKKLDELMDNFNFFIKKMADNSTERLLLVKHAVNAIDNAVQSR